MEKGPGTKKSRNRDPWEFPLYENFLIGRCLENFDRLDPAPI